MKPEHVFYWRPRDLQPLRTFIAIALAILFVIGIYIAVMRSPLVSSPLAEQPVTASEIITSQEISPVRVIPSTALIDTPFLSHFANHTPLSTRGAILSRAESALSSSTNEILADHPVTVPRDIQYAEVPYIIPRTEVERHISPELPPLSNRIGAPMAPAPRPSMLNPSISPKSPLPDLPITSLGNGQSEVTYDLAVTPAGTVSYALPLTPDFANEAIEEWIDTLSFPPAEDKREFRLTLKQSIK